MHGKQFLLDSVYAGIDSTFVYGRLDFAGAVPEMEFDLVVNLESWAHAEARPRRTLRLDAKVQDRKLTGWKVDGLNEPSSLPSGVAATEGEEIAKAALIRNFEFRLPLRWLLAVPGSAAVSQTADHPPAAAIAATSRLRLRFSLWQNRLPVDALPVEGWIELHLVSEAEMHSGI
jgi:hypothetical protein